MLLMHQFAALFVLLRALLATRRIVFWRVEGYLGYCTVGQVTPRPSGRRLLRMFYNNVRAAVARRHWALLEELYSALAQLFQELCCANKTRIELSLENRYMVQGRRPAPCNDMEKWGGHGGAHVPPAETVAFICNQICFVK